MDQMEDTENTNTSSTWHEITVPVSNDHAEEAATRLFLAGFEGLEEREGQAATTHLILFLDTPSAAELDEAITRARDCVTQLLSGPITHRALDPAIWNDNWQRHFPRLELGDHLEVLPPWEEPRADRISVVINPGLAFGTGHHETTAGCLTFLDRLVGPTKRVCDVGCGSGILAIAAAKLGAASCFATDNDPQALATTSENVEANGVGAVVKVATAACDSDSPDLGDAPYDIVVANILAETIVELAAALGAAVAENGTLVLSGIEKTRSPLVEKAFSTQPFTTPERIDDGDWVTLALHRTSES
jgi:ribosomal protein L11 methyltransferase